MNSTIKLMLKAIKLFSVCMVFTLFMLIKPEYGYSQLVGETHWISTYVASWNYNVGGHGNWGNTAREDLNWDSFTHGIFFAQGISAGTCQPNPAIAWDNVSPDRINAFVSDAAANDVPAIMSFGGAGNEAFMDCIESSPETVANGIADFVQQWGFDGADLDAEPVRDHPNYDVFIQTLRQRLPNAIITAAVNGAPTLFARVHPHFDQINIMTYDLSGAWEGWYSWHNSAIFSAGDGGAPKNIPGSSTEYPNVEQWVNRFHDAGVPLEKLGFGIDLYGYVWTGVNAPQQDAAGAQRRFGETSYDNLVAEFPGIASSPQWDADAQAAWYGTSNQFVSFDNQQTIDAKFEYARQKGVGGMIVWEYGGSPNTLIPYIEQQAFGTGSPSLPPAPSLILPDNGATDLSTVVNLEWSDVQGANSYQLQLSQNSGFQNIEFDESDIFGNRFEVSGLSDDAVYYWRVRAINSAGEGAWSETFTFEVTQVATSNEEFSNVPDEFNLAQNYPNPFNPSTVISYSLPQASQVSIKVYNLLGAEVATLVNQQQPAGNFDVRFDASGLSSGIYIYRIVAGNFTQSRKLTLIK